MQYIRICSWCPLIRDGDGGVWWCVLLAVSNDMNTYNLSHILYMCVCMICICCDNFKLYFCWSSKIGPFTHTLVEDAYTKIIDGSLICPKNLFMCGHFILNVWDNYILCRKIIRCEWQGSILKFCKGLYCLDKQIEWYMYISIHRLYFMYS